MHNLDVARAFVEQDARDRFLLLVRDSRKRTKQQESITRVLFNDRTGNIEVMHRFYAHDAEHAVKAIVDSDADILGSEASRERFSAYMHEQFRLLDEDSQPIPLTPVGHEVEGRFLWVYSEAPIPDGLDALTLVHDALRELWPDQANLVNVDRNGETQSALLAGSERQVTVRFDQPRG